MNLYTTILAKMLIPIDKKLHFLAGFGVAAMALPLGIVEAMAAVFTVAVAKELYDYFSGNGTPEWQDIAYTVAGGAAFIGWTMVLAEVMA